MVAGVVATATAGAQGADLTGAGATFPYPIYSKWFADYAEKTGVKINYQSIGSGGGIRQLTEGTVDFGASDAPMSDAEQAKLKVPVLHIPTVLGAVVVTYNVPGVTQPLKLSGAVLAQIYAGTVQQWSAKPIADLNPGVKLPAQDILVVHRSDGSGTTYIWTDYLAKVSEDWKNKVGKGTSVNWPVGLGGKGNEGVTGLIKQTPNAVGYVELIYAAQNNITYGSVKNAAGNFVKADLAGVSAAAASSVKTMPEDFRVSITNPPGKAAYPISSFTWLLVPEKFSEAGKRDATKGFLKWMMADGQSYAEQLSYAKLPKEVVAKELKAIDNIK
jgi:phosphate transport system substrate-binding protein